MKRELICCSLSNCKEKDPLFGLGNKLTPISFSSFSSKETVNKAILTAAVVVTFPCPQTVFPAIGKVPVRLSSRAVTINISFTYLGSRVGFLMLT